MKYLLFALCILASHFVLSQSPFSLNNYGRPSEKALAASGYNSWLGSRTGYMISDTEDFSDDVLLSGSFRFHLIKPKQGSKWTYPFLANASPLVSKFNIDSLDSFIKGVNEIANSDKGLFIAWTPSVKISKVEKENGYTALFGTIALKWNKFQVDSLNKGSLLQSRIGIGFEHAFGKIKDSTAYRWTISASPIITLFDQKKFEEIFKHNESNIFSIEVSAICALYKGVGLMLETSYVKDQFGPLKAGIIYAFAIDK